MADPNFTTLLASNWVWPQNVRPLLLLLSQWIDYSFDESDWVAIEHGLSVTNLNEDRWFSYPLAGHPPLQIELAKEDGADPVVVKVKTAQPTAERLSVQVETTLATLNSFRISA